ncbi:EAL domain-containing protein [Thalassolituus sp.]|uniref:two-component system response regulator n=1 Tax=Thalassolituus sp. TaxID=2030822 RepID=UPI002A821391|nr:EAL domain-containing protein [Thalassolituus sp.]|tara:strand:+ start:8849 stop:11260 length:2412 start_codon:yes stop_codon:yes gene_type:complete
MKHRKILIVEDEKITALDLELTLVDLGYIVVGSAASGEHAIEMAQQLKPDLVLMDIHLNTAMLGTEAARIIVEKQQLPVVFLTAYTDNRSLDAASNCLPYGYLVKPFEKREVDATIRIAFARYDADIEIRLSEQRLRLALDAAHMSVWEWESPSTLSNTVERVAANPPGVISQPLNILLEHIHPEDRVAVQQDVENSAHFSRTIRMRKSSDDEYRRIELFANLFLWSDSNYRVVGVAQDVDDRYKADEKLRQASAVFNCTSEGIIITDEYRKIISVNPAFEKITNYSINEVAGLDPDDFLHARRHSDQFYPRLQDEGKNFWSGEIGCTTKSGHRFPAWEHVCSVYDEVGSLTNYVFTFSDISELRRAERNLARMAYLDALTGLGNRVHMERVLEDAMASRDESGVSVAVLYMDLDGFKVVNDTLGHSEGDRLLQILAQRFQDSVREGDIVTRIGGDEFVIVVQDADGEAGLRKMAQKLLRAVQAPIELNRETVEVSVSIGVAISKPSIKDFDELLRAADTALFEAKHQGKNRVCFYDFVLAMESSERLRIERHLKQALNNNELTVEYQPLIDITNQRVRGAEALCRWYHPELGIIPPDRFIPIAEQSEVIINIGAWVLQESCRAVRGWLDAGIQDVSVAVNVSVRQLCDTSFCNTVAAALKKYDLDAANLELEITESALQSNDRVRNQLEQLRALGVRLAIDDFGTGYSSLSRLKHLPIDRVKIDRSFVKDLPYDESDVEICRAILALCNVLDMQVTAEGVENEAQLLMLSDIGCGCIQGYYFSRSLLYERFIEWAKAYNKIA